LLALRLCFRLDQITKAFDLRQIHAVVFKGTAGKFPWFCNAC
jgi:hypothetical protein